MKKKYIKPMIAEESFQLDAAIAGDCHGNNMIPINHYALTCSYDVFFSHGTCRFDVAGADEDGNDALCYHGPTATQGITFTYS